MDGFLGAARESSIDVPAAYLLAKDIPRKKCAKSQQELGFMQGTQGSPLASCASADCLSKGCNIHTVILQC